MTLRNEFEANLSWLIANNKYTWSYENAGKPNFLCNFSKLFLSNISLFTVCCSRLMSFFLLSRVRPAPMFSSLPTILSLIQVTVREISARIKLVSALFSSLILDIGYLEKGFFRRASCKALRWDKDITINRVCIVQYRIIISFHLAKRVHDPDLGWDRKARYCWLF